MSLVNEGSQERQLASTASVVNGLRRSLSDDGPGFARFHCADEETFYNISYELGNVWYHRDSNSRGVTTIEERSEQAGSGNRGFSADALQWHTDSAGHPHPPRTTLLWCTENEAEGGDSLVAAASTMERHLHCEHPALLKSLYSDNAATFYSGRDRYVGPILSRSNRIIRVRLRLDDLGHLSYPVARNVEDFIAALNQVARTFRLTQGEGYALRNDRWVHARRGYSGRRRMLRMFIA
jgi:hypothetical protein